MDQCLSTILAANNDGRDIKSLLENLGSTYKTNLESGDLFACVADCGWITGHTYVVYGPLLNGSTTFMFESTPVYPNPGRYWDMVQRHGITQFYTAQDMQVM